MSHSHGHDHSGHGHGGHGGHDHSEDIEPALQTLLYQQIEFSKISTLNEAQSDSGAQMVLKTWSQRLDASPVLVSDADEQLLMTVPFAGTVKLHAIIVRSSTSDSAPRTVKIYKNKDDLDFSGATDTTPTQTLTLSQTSDIQEIPVKRPLFGNTYNLSLFVEDNFGAESTEIFYLAFKGDFARLNRDPVEVLYEKAANPQDHAPIVGINDMAASRTGRGM